MGLQPYQVDQCILPRRVRAASTATVVVTYNATNGTAARGQITAAPNTLDGVSLSANDRVLLKDQSTGAQNGIWKVTTLGTGSDGVWDRDTDFDNEADVNDGLFIYVRSGTVNAKTVWMLDYVASMVVGGSSATALAFTRLNPPASGVTTAASVAFTPTGSIASTDVQAAIAEVNTDIQATTLTAGTGLSGGGDLSANRTFNVDADDFTAETAPAVADTVVMYDASAAASRKMTLANLLKVLTLLTAETSPDVADELMLYDASASTTDKITLANLFKVITTLTAETAPAIADELVLYDASGSTADKITLENMLKVVAGLTSLTGAGSATDDDFLIYDTSAAQAKRISRAELATVMGGSSAVVVAAYKTADQGSITEDTDTKVTFDTERLDTNSAFATSTFTAPSTGKWRLELNTEVASTNSSNRFTFFLYVNGAKVTTTARHCQSYAANEKINIHCSWMLSLTASDTVEVYMQCNDGTGTIYGVATPNSETGVTELLISLIGA